MSDVEPGPDRATASKRYERIVLLLACTAQFMVILDVSVVNVALPSIGRDLHYGPTGLQWVPNAYVITFAGFLLLGGRVADLFGRRRAYLAGIGLFVFASLLAGAAQSSLWLTGARAVQGIGSALLSPATLTIVVTTFSGRRLAKAIGIWSAVGSVGGAAGVVLGGVITAELGWRWIFFINVPVGIVGGAAALAALSEHRRTTGRQGLDVPGALTVTVGLALVAYAIASTDRYGWTSGRTLGCLGVGLSLLIVFVLVQLHSTRPLVPLRLFRSRWLAGANGIVLLLGTWTFATWYFYSLYLQDVVGFSALRTGVALLPATLMITLGAQISSRVAMVRLGIRRTVQMALLLGFGGYLWLSMLQPGDRYWAGVFGAGLMISFGQGLLWTPLVSAATGGVDPSEAGLASGLLNNSRQIGGSIGLAALATIAAARSKLLEHGGTPRATALTAGYARAFTVTACLLVMAMGVSFILPRRAVRKATPDALAAALPSDSADPARPAAGGPAVLAVPDARGPDGATTGPS